LLYDFEGRFGISHLHDEDAVEWSVEERDTGESSISNQGYSRNVMGHCEGGTVLKLTLAVELQ
jgi:hypothetical protein